MFTFFQKRSGNTELIIPMAVPSAIAKKTPAVTVETFRLGSKPPKGDEGPSEPESDAEDMAEGGEPIDAAGETEKSAYADLRKAWMAGDDAAGQAALKAFVKACTNSYEGE